ncbi:MAG: hypothetical protein AAGD07_16545 [Planctomycetota bacterium]
MSSTHSPRRFGSVPQRSALHFSFAAMLAMVMVMAFFLAGLLYATRIPEVQEDIAIWRGTEVVAAEEGRRAQIIFLVFTYTAPVSLAALISIAQALSRRFTNRTSVGEQILYSDERG